MSLPFSGAKLRYALGLDVGEEFQTRMAPEFDGYLVTDHGKVISFRKKGRPRELKRQEGDRRVRVGLYKRGLQLQRRVDHLVLNTFVGERPGSMVPRYRDGNWRNVALENLYWGFPETVYPPLPTEYEGCEVLQIPRYEGYAVSAGGHVLSGQSGKWRSLKPSANHAGYLSVTLRRNLVPRIHKVHYLVLLTFVGPRPEGQQCCHNNGQRTDNSLQNLRYGTAAENCADRIRHGNQQRKLTPEQVHEIRDLFTKGVSDMRIARRYGMSENAIWKIRKRRTWNHLP